MTEPQPDSSPSAGFDGPHRSGTVAIVVFHHPVGDFRARLARVAGQVAEVIVVANDGGDPGRVADVGGGRIRHVASAGNPGLGAALNLGLELARSAGARWCLLLDQDTSVDAGLLDGLAEVYGLHPRHGSIGLIAPNYRSPESGRLAYPIGPPYGEPATVVTSGSVLRLEAVAAVGPMMEEFFIEGIDIEYCLRLRASGFLVVASGRPLMTHGAGACIERRFLWRTVLVGAHSPWRYYLQFRNLTWILIHLAGSSPAWAARTVISMGKRLVLISIYEADRCEKFIAIARGVVHGFRGRLGRNGERRITRARG
jgi:rhamnosyltransferase